MKKWILPAFLAVSSLMWGAEAPYVSKATANLKAAKGSEVSGTVTFTEVQGGVKIVGDFKGLKPGYHGFHIHEKGDCDSDDFMTAGGHFNPGNKKHGGPDAQERHAGDLGNLKALNDGTAHYERVDTVIKLNGPDTIVGRALMVHSDPDDFVTQPTGNAGGRLGCGVIQAAQ